MIWHERGKIDNPSETSQGDDGYKTFSVRIREDVVQRIDEISAQTGRSRNELIDILLEFSLDRCSIEPK